MERKRRGKKEEEDNGSLAGLGLGAAFLGGAGLLYGGYKLFQSLQKEGQLSETGGNFNEWQKSEEQTSSKTRIDKTEKSFAKTEKSFAKTEKSLAKTETSIDKTEMRQDKNKCDADEDLCKICLDKMVNTVFTDCGHMVCCTSCCEQLRSCPICRKKITNWIKVYKS